MVHSGGIEGGFDPLRLAIGFDHHDIESASGLARQSHQVMLCGTDDPFLFASRDAGQRAAKRRPTALSHFDKHQRAIGLAHDEVNFTATPTRRSIIAPHQHQALRLQMLQRKRLGCIAQCLGRHSAKR